MLASSLHLWLLYKTMTIPVLYLSYLTQTKLSKKKKKNGTTKWFFTLIKIMWGFVLFILWIPIFTILIVYLCMIAGWSEIDKFKQLWWKVCHPYHVTWMGVTQVWFWYGSACCWEFEIGPIHTPNFQEKVTHLFTNWPDFDQNYLIFAKFS